MNSHISLNFGQVRLLTSVLLALECRKLAPTYLEWWKCCPIDSDLIFYRIFLILEGNKGSHKISEEFEFQPDKTIHFGVTCP